MNLESICMTLFFQAREDKYYSEKLQIKIVFITEFFDQLDGVVARLQGPTKLGSFLDSSLDRIGDFFLFVGVILVIR